MKSYFDENLTIKKLALEILEDIPSKISFENNY